VPIKGHKARDAEKRPEGDHAQTLLNQHDDVDGQVDEQEEHRDQHGHLIQTAQQQGTGYQSAGKEGGIARLPFGR
jgi:hypothetical protein